MSDESIVYDIRQELHAESDQVEKARFLKGELGNATDCFPCCRYYS